VVRETGRMGNCVALLEAVDQTLQNLAGQPGLGSRRTFANPALQGLRSCLVVRPFHRHVLFYRYDEKTLDAVRVMHSARDLERRLSEPPG